MTPNTLRPPLPSASATHPGVTWTETPFFTMTLPTNAALCHRRPDLSSSLTAREAMNLAYSLFEYLPLHSSLLTKPPFHLGTALGETWSTQVVAERIPRIPDVSNRAAPHRVDFFAYRQDGTVVRYHPGKPLHSSIHSAEPHVMPPGCILFRSTIAYNVGCGAALHVEPPGCVARSLTMPWPEGALQPHDAVFTRTHMKALHAFDIKALSSRFALAAMNKMETSADWTDGKHFPWWVLLASAGSELVGDGIINVSAFPEESAIRIINIRGSFEICSELKIRALPTR